MVLRTQNCESIPVYFLFPVRFIVHVISCVFKANLLSVRYTLWVACKYIYIHVEFTDIAAIFFSVFSPPPPARCFRHWRRRVLYIV